VWINWPLSLKTKYPVSIMAEFVRYDLSNHLPGFGIVCQFLACFGRRKIIGQAE